MYRDAVTGQRYGRSGSEADIAVKKLLANDTGALSYVSPVIIFIHTCVLCFSVVCLTPLVTAAFNHVTKLYRFVKYVLNV